MEAVEEDLPVTRIDSASEDRSVAKERVLVATLPLDLVNRPKVSKTVEKHPHYLLLHLHNSAF